MDLESYETFETEMPKEGELKGKLAPGAEIEYWRVFDRIKLARVK